jgi:hypothetical protein
VKVELPTTRKMNSDGVFTVVLESFLPVITIEEQIELVFLLGILDMDKESEPYRLFYEKLKSMMDTWRATR